jgi:hypothetical protein
VRQFLLELVSLERENAELGQNSTLRLSAIRWAILAQRLDGLPTGRRVFNGKRSRFFCFQIPAIYGNHENGTVLTVPTVPTAENVTPE